MVDHHANHDAALRFAVLLKGHRGRNTAAQHVSNLSDLSGSKEVNWKTRKINYNSLDFLYSGYCTGQ